MKKRMLLAMLLALALVMMSACSGDPVTEVTPVETEEAAAEPTEEAAAEPEEEEPTAEPTEEPTAEPTEEPTAEPTEEPTAEPAAQADEEPEAEPAAQADEEPEAEPAAQADEEIIGGADGETEIAVESEDEEDPVLATAYDGDIVLTLSELQDTYDDALSYYIAYYAQYGYDIDEYDEDLQASVAQEAVQMEMSQRVILRHAQDQGYELTEEKEEELMAQVQTVLDSVREYYESYLSYYGYEGEELTKIVDDELAASGYTVDVLYENALLTDVLNYLYDLSTADVTVTEEEVKEAFDAKVAAAKETYADVDSFISDYLTEADILYTPEDVRLMYCIYIALEDEDEEAAEAADEATASEATEAEATAGEATDGEATDGEATDGEATAAEAEVDIETLSGRKKAQAVLAAIRGGLDFVDAMLTYNEDTSTEAQMMLGYPVAEGSELYSVEFQDGAMALEQVGDVSDVIETDYGYFILCYAEDMESGEADFESRRDAETEAALATKQDEVYSAYIDAALEDAGIETNDVTVLYHVYVGETVEAMIAYAQVTEETALTDMPEGDVMATLGVGVSLDLLGHIGVDGEEYVFVAVPGTEIKGYVNVAATADMEEEDALAVDNAALITMAEVPDKQPTFTIAMNDGSLIYGELYPDIAPESVGNFVSLAQSGFYDGLTFHRVVAGFVIQGGDPNGDGTGGPGYSIRGEFTNNGVENNLSHTRGVLSMARSSAMDSAGSQFFIMHADNDYLDGDYAAFGMVLGGIETVDLIASVPTNSNNKPMTDQVMRTVYAETYGKTYEFTKLED